MNAAGNATSSGCRVPAEVLGSISVPDEDSRQTGPFLLGLPRERKDVDHEVFGVRGQRGGAGGGGSRDETARRRAELREYLGCTGAIKSGSVRLGSGAALGECPGRSGRHFAWVRERLHSESHLG